MRFVDETVIEITSGKGGDGCVSFRREKFVPRGGPDGGDGGQGGSVWIQGVLTKHSLLDFHNHQRYRAGDGKRGLGKKKHGAKGKSLRLEAPLGTIIRRADEGTLLLEILDENPQLCLEGGEGGKGNARMKTSVNRTPMHASLGQAGQSLDISLELKLLADIGLVGLPNAGKSTLISRISRASPKIADYPFTTLIPNLGVVPASYADQIDSFVVADIPGIIQGAHQGSGLGTQFLKHIERSGILLFMLEQAPLGQLKKNWLTLNQELQQFNPSLAKKTRLVALTKIDLILPQQIKKSLQYLRQLTNVETLAISALSGENIAQLIQTLSQHVAQYKRFPLVAGS